MNHECSLDIGSTVEVRHVLARQQAGSQHWGFSTEVWQRRGAWRSGISCLLTVAGSASCGGLTPELAAEMYLASLLVIDDTSFMERAYLDEFARQLKLPTALKAELEKQASAN